MIIALERSELPVRRLAIRAVAASLILALWGRPGAAQNQLWLEQFGSPASDLATLSAPTSGGGVIFIGNTLGVVAPTSGGYLDFWMARYDGANNLLWVRQYGSVDVDVALSVSPDGSDGVFLCGYTNGELGAPPLGTYNDAWLAHFDAAGNPLWLRQYGTIYEDQALAVAADGAGGVFVGGTTWGSMGGPNAGNEDIWLAHYDGAGQQRWMRQYGSASIDQIASLQYEPAGYLLAGGDTKGDFGGALAGKIDVWLARFDLQGNQEWARKVASPYDDFISEQVTDGSGGTYASGWTQGTLGAAPLGGLDAWVARYDALGTQLWIRQFGAHQSDYAYGSAPAASGGVYLGGKTSSALYGTFHGVSDAWLTRFDESGTQVWAVQFGTDMMDFAVSISSTGPNELVACGSTFGDMGGGDPGQYLTDAWFARYDDACGVGPAYCSASATSIPGCQAALSATGSPRLSHPDDFAVSSGDIPGGNIGLCYFGDNGAASIPLGTLGGLVCVQPPKFRSAPKSGGGNPGLCDGSLSFTLQDMLDSSPIIVPGAVIHSAIWSRDPANPDGFLLSDGLQFTVCP